LRALIVGLLAFVLVTQATAEAMQAQAQTPATRQAKVPRAPTLDEQLERKLAAVRKYRGTIRFFRMHRSVLSAGDQKTAAKSTLRHAQVRVRELTKTISVLRAKIRKRDARRLDALPPRRAICDVFGSHCREAVAVAQCESGLSTTAHNGEYLGLFQMGSYERQLFGHGTSAIDQAAAAHRYFVRSGHDWSPWSCRWAAA
jgi:Lysozyme like domain